MDTPAQRPKVRIEATTFSHTLRGLLGQLHVDVFGGGRCTVRVFIENESLGMELSTTVANTLGSDQPMVIYRGPLWQTQDDVFAALCEMTKRKLETGE